MVTGASSGIGLEVARRLAARGAAVVLVARGADGLQRAALECTRAGAKSVQVLPCDVGDHRAVAAAVDEVVLRHGRLDAVVNAAGVFAAGRTTDIPAEVFDAVVRTNLLGSANVARAVVPVLQRQQAGTLVLVGSLLGHVTSPYVAPYVVSKWGVRALARVLQAELRKDDPGVRVACVAPTGVDTPIYERAANHLGRQLSAPRPLMPVDVVSQDVIDLVDGRSRPRLAAPVPRLFHAAARAGFGLLPARAFDAVVSGVLVTTALEDEAAEPTEGAALESLS